jgi:methenyltetrahydromethanopterin cyclohydrolase
VPSLTLNERAGRLADHLAGTAAMHRIAVQTLTGGARVIDCGVKCTGGLQAGLALARICLAGHGEVSLGPALSSELPWPLVQVWTDHPSLACMASQYAGWQIAVGKFFAMGSGPMRAAHGKEELYDRVGGREQPPLAVGVLETQKLPGDEVAAYIAERVQLPPEKLTLLAAATTSIAGTLQVVARSLETALHKMFELGFDLAQVQTGFGTAPLPPVAADFLAAIGRTNDAILYGGQVVLWVEADDDQLAELGPRIPSSSSADFGEPFADIFRRYDQDFYKVDPFLFSPAQVCLQNLRTGRTHRFGTIGPEVLRRSFFAGS